MISKTLQALTAKKSMGKLVAIPSRAMGGGKKKPAIKATETNFDVVFVGK